MTTWLCVSPRTTLLSLLSLPPLIPIFYWNMERKHSQQSSTATCHKGIPYRPLNSTIQHNQHDHLTMKEKCQTVGENCLLFVSFFTGIFTEYLTIEAVVTTLAFPTAPFVPRDHYQYYYFSFLVGELIGRSYGFVVAFLMCDMPSYTKKTWIFTLLILLSFLFLVLAAWFRFLHNVWVVLVLVQFIGINAGALFTCTFAAAGSDLSARHKQFLRAFLTFAISSAAVSAGLLGLVTEASLKDHCFSISQDDRYCITRLMNTTASKCL